MPQRLLDISTAINVFFLIQTVHDTVCSMFQSVVRKVYQKRPRFREPRICFGNIPISSRHPKCTIGSAQMNNL